MYIIFNKEKENIAPYYSHHHQSSLYKRSTVCISMLVLIIQELSCKCIEDRQKYNAIICTSLPILTVYPLCTSSSQFLNWLNHGTVE